MLYVHTFLPRTCCMVNQSSPPARSSGINEPVALLSPLTLLSAAPTAGMPVVVQNTVQSV
eukprot:110114-Pyramimonas_sp.AAC.1